MTAIPLREGFVGGPCAPRTAARVTDARPICRPRSGRPTRVCASLLFILVPFFARAAPWSPSLSVSSTWNDNVTNANVSSDRIGALQTMADLAAGDRFGIGRNDALHLSARVAGTWWPRFTGLTQTALGARAEWRHKFGLGALAPVFSTEVAVDAVRTKETGRQGTSSGVTFALRKRFGDAFRAALTQEFAEHAARLAPFDRAGAETAFEADRDLTDNLNLSFRASYRDGDVLAYGTPPRPDLVALAPNRMPVLTFGRTMVAYSIAARTAALRLALTRRLGASSALSVGYEWRETERTPLRYVNHLVSTALVHQF